MNESQIFTEALKLVTPSERSAFLDEACAGQPQLRSDVEALLRAQHAHPDFLEQPAEPFEKTAMHGQLPLGNSVPKESLDELEGKGSVLGGRYKLYEQIGEGGMGTVWLALQSVPVRRQVAVKLIKAGMDSRDVISRFQAERQALALMDHPNIARVLDAGTTPGGRPYFVMELVKGIPLTKYCDEKRLSLRERLELFIPVCQAIQHAHQKGIIHRDIKPSNVLVCLYDGRPVPKVIDFGVAKATGQQLTEQTLVTGFGSIVGTLEYMSPEQAELNQLDIDTRSDIYSLGVLLYELLTGTTPLERKRFQQAAMFELLRLIREVDPPRPSLRLSESKETLPSISAQRKSEPARLTTLVRGELDWIVMKALEKDRNRRYETANGFLMDIQRYLADEPVQACPPSTVYRLRKFVRRNRAVLTAGSLVVMALLLGVLLSVWQAVRATKAEGVAREEQAKAKRLANDESQARAVAVDQTRLANERAEELARRLYVHGVNLAYREVEANNIGQADALLDACEPSRRGWEWSFSKQLCHLEKMTLGGFANHAEAMAAARRGPAAPPETGDPSIDKVVWELMGASGNVRSVAISPDGKQVASAHDDGTIGIFDTRSGKEIRSLAGHSGCASCVTFDTEGRWVISGGLDRTIRVWDANTGEAIHVLRGHTQPILSIAHRPGTEELASSGFGTWAKFEGEGFEIKQWDLGSLQEIRTLHHGHGWAYTSVAYSADGKRLFSSANWGGQLRIWDAATGEQLEERRMAENSRGLAVSSADGRIAFSGPSNLLYVGALDFGSEMRSFRGQSAPIIGIAFSRDGNWVASACEDSTITIWNVANGRVLKSLRGHTASVNAVAFHPDNRTLVSSSADGTIKSWDIPQQIEGLPLNGGDWANRVSFSPDGRQTAVVRFSAAYVIDSTSRQVQYDAPPLGQLSYSRDGRFLATCDKDSDTVNLRNAKTGMSIATSPKSTGPIRSLCFGTGNSLAFAPDDGGIHFWDVETGETESIIHAGEAAVLGMSFNGAGTALATIGLDCAVRLWNPNTGQLVRQLGNASGRLPPYVSDGVAFDPAGRRLAAVRGDATVAVWETETGAEVQRLHGHTRAINAVTYSPDGRRIATASEDFTIKLWDAVNGEEVLTLRGHTGFVLGLAFSPDGNSLRSASADGTVRTWDAMPEYAALDQRMSEVLGGQPAKDTQELLAFGQRAYDLHRFALATRWFSEALERDDAIAANRKAQHAYNAACVAVLAANDHGIDDPRLDESSKARLRNQALDWLHAELKRWTLVITDGKPDDRPFVVQTLDHWQLDSDLSGVRGDAIEKLPESERAAWRALWAAVEAVRSNAASKDSPSPP